MTRRPIRFSASDTQTYIQTCFKRVLLSNVLLKRIWATTRDT